MNRLRAALAVLLILCVVVVGGVASAQSITHETHHSHHQKSTHGTVLCSWMCAAGQVLESHAAPNLIERSPVLLFNHTPFLFVPHITLDSATSRGPPVHPTI